MIASDQQRFGYKKNQFYVIPKTITVSVFLNLLQIISAAM